MKLRILYTFSFLFFISIVFLSNSTGRAVTANEGNTGAPNDNANMNRTCQTCHNNGSFTVTPEIEIKDAGDLWGKGVHDTLATLKERHGEDIASQRRRF